MCERSDHDGPMLCQALAGTVAFEKGDDVVPGRGVDGSVCGDGQNMVVEAGVDGEMGEKAGTVDEPLFDSIELEAAEKDALAGGMNGKRVSSSGGLERK